MKLLKNNRRFYEFWTLKRRIIFIFIASSLLSFSILAWISHYAINSILSNKIDTVIQNNLKQVQLSLENTISNLNHVSQQLTYHGSVGNQLAQFLHEENSFARAQLVANLKSELNMITFTNPNIGLTAYYFAESGSTQFENSAFKEGFDPDDLPMLASYYGINYYGPHVSRDRFSNAYVFSALREVNMPEDDHVYIYLETGFNLTADWLESNSIGRNSHHLVLDNSGRISYSELDDVFPVHSYFPGFSDKASSGSANHYYWYKSTTNQGWSLVSLIPHAEYNKEKSLWEKQLVVVAGLFLIISLLLALLLWKMVYKPLASFHNEIRGMSQSSQTDSQPDAVPANIPEFDQLLVTLRRMKEEIRSLFVEVERKERLRADLEIEKMLYQINPHFLMNTLDTAHWLAVMNGQDEIDRLVVSLNRLLFYNLGKLGEQATVREELDALKEYLTLQQTRYDFEFDVRIHADESALNLQIPRFILQPLVENALYHGLKDDGFIQVEVRYDACIRIEIRDDGAGMTEETIRRLLEQEQTGQEKVGMGIGMNYVKRMLHAYYGGQASLDIVSTVGEGTTVTILLPAAEEERHD